MNERRLKIAKLRQSRKEARLEQLRTQADIKKEQNQTRREQVSHLLAILKKLDSLGDRDINVNVETERLEKILSGIKTTPQIKTGDVVVNTDPIAKEVAAIKSAIGKDNVALKQSMSRLIETLKKEDPGQQPTDFLPFRRVIRQGGQLKFDDSLPTGSFSGGGGSIPLPTYGIARIDDASDPSYYGFENNDGDWYILRETASTGKWEYTAGTGGIDGSWAGRAGLTYADKGSVF